MYHILIISQRRGYTAPENTELMDKTHPDITEEAQFGLIETILWENGKYFLFDLHMERLLSSARHFSIPADREKIMRALADVSRPFSSRENYRVRLVLDKHARPDVSYGVQDKITDTPVKIAFSDKTTDSEDVFLYHKTTNRALYDAASAEARTKGFFDMIFANKEGEITEGAITNVMVLKGKDYFTPPIFCGLLPGVFRTFLLQSQQLPVKEKVLYKEDLLSANSIFVMNSVRKLLPAELAR